MIPPLVLDVQPHHYVLDMCAAPGSKTVQLLEALHAREDQTSGSEPATGLLIANDSDLKRTHMLVHQSLNRVGSPNMMVTQHDAAIYPALRANGAGDPLLFDRILADVPCSGDGTLRKNVAIWRNWTVADGLGLHACVAPHVAELIVQATTAHPPARRKDAAAGRTGRLLDLLAQPARERVGRQRRALGMS